MKQKVRVALIQAKPYPELHDPQNVGHALRLLQQCRGHEVDIAVLPEYFPWNGDEVLADLARSLRCYVVAGLVEEGLSTKLFATASLFDRRGRLVGRQRKRHLRPVERDALGITPADEAYEVIDTDFGRLGILLGIDFWGLPDGAKFLREQGAELIINPAIFPNLRGHWRHAALVRALEVFVPVVGVNSADFNYRAGGRVYRHSGGGSMIIQPPRLIDRDAFMIWFRGLDALDDWVTVELDRREQVHIGEVDLGTTRRYHRELKRQLGLET